jgi:hypothetical protein
LAMVGLSYRYSSCKGLGPWLGDTFFSMRQSAPSRCGASRII